MSLFWYTDPYFVYRTAGISNSSVPEAPCHCCYQGKMYSRVNYSSNHWYIPITHIRCLWCILFASFTISHIFNSKYALQWSMRNPHVCGVIPVIIKSWSEHIFLSVMLRFCFYLNFLDKDIFWVIIDVPTVTTLSLLCFQTKRINHENSPQVNKAS